MPFSRHIPENGMNRNLMLALVVILVAAAGFYLYGRMKGNAPPDLAPVGANLIDGLGDYSMPVTSKGKDVQRWLIRVSRGLWLHPTRRTPFLKPPKSIRIAPCAGGRRARVGPTSREMDRRTRPGPDRLRGHRPRRRMPRKRAGVQRRCRRAIGRAE